MPAPGKFIEPIDPDAPGPAPALDPASAGEVPAWDVFESIIRPQLTRCASALEKLGVRQEDLALPYGCGALGCVYGTRTSNVVVKTTCQDGEAQLSEVLREWRARERTRYPSALPVIHAVRLLKCPGGARPFKTKVKLEIGQGRHTDTVEVCSGRVYAIQREDILDLVYPRGIMVQKLLEDFVDDLDERPVREHIAKAVQDPQLDAGARAAILTFLPAFLEQVMAALRGLRDRGIILYDLHAQNFGLRAGTGAGTPHPAEYVIRDIGAFLSEDPQTLRETEIPKLSRPPSADPALGLGDLAVGAAGRAADARAPAAQGLIVARGLEGIRVGTRRPRGGRSHGRPRPAGKRRT